MYEDPKLHTKNNLSGFQPFVFSVLSSVSPCQRNGSKNLHLENAYKNCRAYNWFDQNNIHSSFQGWTD